MERSKEDIIAQLMEALRIESDAADYWRRQALSMMESDVYGAIYGQVSDEQAV